MSEEDCTRILCYLEVLLSTKTLAVACNVIFDTSLTLVFAHRKPAVEEHEVVV